LHLIQRQPQIIREYSLTDEIYNFGFELYIIPISFLR